MALATQCPHCGTLFRVAADQLKLRGGIVRCGACQQVFDGNAGLVDPAGKSAPVPATGPSAAPAPALASSGAAPRDDELPIYTLEFDHTFAPFGILPQPAEPPPPDLRPAPPAPPPPAAPAPTAPPAAPAAPAAPAKAGNGADTRVPDVAPLLRKAAAGVTASTVPSTPVAPAVAARTRLGEPRARRSTLAPTKIATPPRVRLPETDEPEFVRRARAREQSGKGWRFALLAACVVLLAGLLMQGAFGARDLLAARYPSVRPVLVGACTVLGCQVGLPARAEQLAIDTGELITLGQQAYTFQTLLRNLGDYPLAWPSLELTLLDANDQPVLRRVFGPGDYLGKRTATDAGLPAQAEQPVTIHFRLDGLEPSGYHIAVFYP